MVKHLCEERRGHVHNIPVEERSPDAFLQDPSDMETAYPPVATPLVGALMGKHKDLALYLLALPNPDLDLEYPLYTGYAADHDMTYALEPSRGIVRLLHMCCPS
jgi:hypothetical protein